MNPNVKVKCAVNGFGRIGRMAFKNAWEDPDIEVVHINDLCSLESAAYLVKYDSVHGIWDRKVVQVSDNEMSIDGR